MKVTLVAVTAATLITALACQRAVDALPGFTRAIDGERASVLRVIADYYRLREYAALTGDASLLFAAYPRLGRGEDRGNGVNADRFFVERMRAARIAGMTFELERYEPIGVYVKEDVAIAFVHGLETWLNDFGPATKGEFYTRIELIRGTGGWRPVLTDEVMMHERPPRTPAP